MGLTWSMGNEINERERAKICLLKNMQINLFGQAVYR